MHFLNEGMLGWETRHFVFWWSMFHHVLFVFVHIKAQMPSQSDSEKIGIKSLLLTTRKLDTKIVVPCIVHQKCAIKCIIFLSGSHNLF